MRLIDKYLPADYSDSVFKRVKLGEPLTPDGIFEEMFCHFPKPVDWLIKLRNALVKPLGLQGGGGFRNLIAEHNDEEIIICKNDKHLCFWVSIYCSLPYFLFDASDMNSPVPKLFYVNNQLKLKACEVNFGTGMPLRAQQAMLPDMIKFWQPEPGGPVQIIYGGYAAKIMSLK